MNTSEIISAIIREQSQIVGDSLSKQMALESGVVTFRSQGVDDISITAGDSNVAISKLIQSYGRLFGPASIEVCKNIVRRHSGSDDISFLQTVGV